MSLQGVPTVNRARVALALAVAAVVMLALAAVAVAATAPTAITGAVTAYGPTSATVTGTVNPNGDATSWYFEVGTTTAYGTRTAATNAGSGTTNATVSGSFSSLSAGTTYHYRFVAVNSGGTSVGSDGIFTTIAAPAAVTGAPSSLTTTSATLNGSINANGRATTWYFEYGKTTGYGTKTAVQSAGAGTSTVPVSASLSGLQTGATYHYRLVATSDAGTSQGADQTLMVAAAPAVATNPASSIGNSSARLNGSVNPNGLSTSWYFEYGTSTGYGSRTATASAGSSTSSMNVSASISSLAGGTTYHFRLVAANGSGTTLGNDQSFAILGPPAVQTGAAQGAGATSATVTGSVNPEGHPTTWYFDYGTTTSYGTKTAASSAGSGTAATGVSLGLSGLKPSTTYHYRLVASSSAGTTQGADATFATLPSVSLAVSTFRSVYGRYVALSGTVTGGQQGVSVTVLAQPFGASGFSTVATVLSGAGGIWSYPAQPKRLTTYQASASGGTSTTLTIGVQPAVSLRVITKARLSTRVVASTSFAGKFVQLQRQGADGKWITISRARLNAKSNATFRAAALPLGRSTIRIAMSVNQAGPGYLAGFSRSLLYNRI